MRRIFVFLLLSLGAAACFAQSAGTAPVAKSRDTMAVLEHHQAAKKNKTKRTLLTAASVSRRMAGGAGRDVATPGMFSPGQQSSANAGAVARPKELRMERGASFDGDVRTLPATSPSRRERPEREPPPVVPIPFPGTSTPMGATPAGTSGPTPGTEISPSVPSPAPLISFDGLSYSPWGAGHPPDPNGDVGPTYYIQTINTSVGIFNKSTGAQVAAFNFNTLMSQGHFGNLCDTNNFGDPVVLYDTFEDRWVVTDFAFKFDTSGNILNPPGSFQCFAVSKSGDPVSGGWNFYSINTTGGLGDYPKFGIWPDGIYMSTNMFDYAASGNFQNVRLYAFNKAQMYAGAPTIQVVSFDAPAAEFTMLPANARLQTGTPPAGSPNYFATVWQYLDAISIYKFHVDWKDISMSTLTGPFMASTSTWWAQFSLNNNTTAPTPANSLDTLYPRLMVQNQYTNLNGVESLWDSQTAGAGNPTSNVTSSQAAVRFYQLTVSGGSVASSTTQNFTFSPDGTMYRYMPSVAVNSVGDMAIGYTTSNSTTNPGAKYAGRLSTDSPNTITQTEQTLIQGTGSQSGSCGSSACARWGDYSAMTLDPDGCTFWYTNEYYTTTGLNDSTRIGAFRFPTCSQTQIATGTIQGNVSVGAVPVTGATVSLGSGRRTTTDTSGNYSFADIPAGTYPGMTATFPGLQSGAANNVVVTSGGVTTQNFALTTAPTSGCLTDTTQADFQAGIPTNCNLTGSPGSVTLASPSAVDQQNTSVTSNGYGFNNTNWAGQTFIPAVTGSLTRVDVNLFCSTCTGTTSNITVSIRATTGSPKVPTGADLAVATIPAFSSGSGGYFTASFNTPATVSAGVAYAIVIRAASSISAGSYAYVCSCSTDSNPYTNGSIVTSSNSGTSWSADNTAGGRDLGFITYVNSGFSSSGTFISSLKDANPATGVTPDWNTLSWTASTPTGTSVQFQAAASNNSAGPFNFVGPDGTASTFFTNGGSLAQFNGMRYLRYQAKLATTISSATPVLNDVTVCFTDGVSPTSLAVAAASGTYGGSTTFSATLMSASNPVNGETIAFTLGGNAIGSAVTNSSGVATLSNVSLAGYNAGTYSGAVAASFAGDTNFAASSGSNTLTVSQSSQTISFAALPNKVYNDPDFTVSATASSGLTVSFSASGQCTVSGSLVHLTGAGSCTITASQAGNTNYLAAPNVPQSFSITAPSPVAVSVTPNSGSGLTQNFQYSFSDLGGYSYIGTLQTLINGSLSYSGSCATYYDVPSNSIWLIQDNGSSWSGPITLGTAGSLQNSQCTLNTGSSSASGSGTTLTLNLALTFNSSFVGPKNQYLLAIDNANGSSGWQNRGTWTPASASNTPPAPGSVTPTSGSGLTQTFQYSVSDANGYSYISTTQTMINGTLTYGGSCTTFFDVPSKSIWLIQDSGSGWIGPKNLGSTGTLQNSQCTLDTGNSSSSGSGTTLTLNLALTFSPSFVGVKNQYLLAVDNANASSGWQKLGTWTPANASNTPPSAVSVTPNSGTGLTQTFQYSFSDTNGFGYITTAQTLTNGTLAYSGSCATYYDVASSSIWLIQDNGLAWSGPKKLGATGTLQNSQCTLDTGSSSVTSSGNTLTLNLALTFASSFVGAKNQYELAVDATGQSSGWQNLGTWIPAAASNTPPSAVSITPNAGSGLTQNFQYVFSDANGYTYIQTVQTLTGASLSYPASCTTYFDVASSSIWLIQDSGAAWTGPKKLGTAATTLQNSQCTLDVANATATGSGNNLTLTLPLTFSGSFAGTKSSYSLAIDNAGATSGWQNLATWTVP